MKTKVVVWVIPALFAVALLRSLLAAESEPVRLAQVPNLFDEPAEVDRELYGEARPGEPDPDEYQPRSRLVRSMYDMLDGMRDQTVEGQGIDDEQRRFIRRELMRVDDELAESGGSNLRRAIIRANNPRNTFSVGKPSATQPMRRDLIDELHRLPDEPNGRVPTPAVPVNPAPVNPVPVNPVPVNPAPVNPPPVVDPFGN